MKKIFCLVLLTILAVVCLSFAGEDSQEELRPLQKIMKERASDLILMNKLLSSRKFRMISNSAHNLMIETKKTAESLTDPLAKEITLDIAGLAEDITVAVVQKDGKTIKEKLTGIKGKCQECHRKFRK